MATSEPVKPAVHNSIDSFQINLASGSSPLSTLIPASSVGNPDCEAANVIILSDTNNSSVLIYVTVPETVKSPPIITLSLNVLLPVIVELSDKVLPVTVSPLVSTLTANPLLSTTKPESVSNSMSSFPLLSVKPSPAN